MPIPTAHTPHINVPIQPDTKRALQALKGLLGVTTVGAVIDKIAQPALRQAMQAATEEMPSNV